MQSTAWRTAASAIAFILLIGATLWLLDRFARHEFSAHLRDQAAQALALAASGGTPFEWRFRTADDIIAGHPFGTGDFRFTDATLRLQPDQGPFEIGLPLSRPVDLRQFPQLHIVIDAESAGEMRVVLREQLQSVERTSAPIAFGAGRFDATRELAQLGWTVGSPATATASAPPDRAAMLRLRFSMVGHEAIAIHRIALPRSLDDARLDIAQSPRIVDAAQALPTSGLDVYRLPFAGATQQTDIAEIAAKSVGDGPPLVLLPERGRVEQQIALRDAVYAALPAAILIPEGAVDQTFARARELAANGPQLAPASTRWRLIILFAAVLAIARLRPPGDPRWRALLEIALTVGAPMAVIVGGYARWSAPQQALIALTLIYAISLSFTHTWRWIGTAPAWIAAAAVVAMALVIGLALHRTGSSRAAPGASHIARYLVWALLQQYLICAVCTERWRLLTGNALLAVYFGALGFALLHTPNAALMLATFIGGLCWCAIYLRYRALLPLAVSHAASAILLSVLLPVDIIHSAEVSVRFFQ